MRPGALPSGDWNSTLLNFLSVHVCKEFSIISRIKVHCEYVGRKCRGRDGGTALLMPNVDSRCGVIVQFHSPVALLSRKIPSLRALEDGMVP